MRSAPSVTVVIPAYNHASFVDEAIRSVVDQTWTEWRLIIVDDGSEDGTFDRCREWAARDSRIQVLQQANQGSHAAINRGVASVETDVVMVLNSDDRWHPERMTRVLQAFEDSGAQFVVTGCRLIDGQGRPITDSSHWWNKTQAQFREWVLRVGPVEGLLYGNYTVSTSNFAFRKTLWDAVGPIPRRRMIPDWEWAVRAALHDPQGLRFLMDESLLDYRLHGANAILSKMMLGTLEIGRLHARALEALGVPTAMVHSVFRNQRDLRRHVHRQSLAGVEPLLKAREDDVATLQTEVRRIEQLTRAREADVSDLQAQLRTMERQLATAEGYVRQREHDVSSLVAERDRALGFLRARETDLVELRDALAQTEQHLRAREQDVVSLLGMKSMNEELTRTMAVLKASVDEAESSLTWRLIRRLRRRFSWFRI